MERKEFETLVVNCLKELRATVNQVKRETFGEYGYESSKQEEAFDDLESFLTETNND